MSSSGDIVKRALKRIGIVAPGEDVDAADAQDGGAALNAMIASWQNDGVDISPDVPVASKHEDGIVALLAVRLAPDYGKVANVQIQADAQRGWDGLLADYIRVPSAQFDPALSNMPSQRQWVGRTNPALWKPQCAYSVGDIVQYRGRVYECSIAGTSGATSGPTGRGTVIDGTVTWVFSGVI